MNAISRISVSKWLFGTLCAVVLLSPIVAIASPAVPAWRLQKPWSTETATIRIGEETITAEIADTGELRERGLGYRDGLDQGAGMLFVYQTPGTHSFWMKGMRFCLDIVWIEGGEIKGAAENVCPVEGVPDSELPHYLSPEPVAYVLELPANWLRDHGFGAGTAVEIDLP